MQNLMIDIETLGTKVDAPIIRIGACFFDMVTGEIGQGFDARVSLESALMAGKLDTRTLEFWLTRASEEARTDLFRGAQHNLSAALLSLSNFCVRPADDPALIVWTKGPSFDVAILERAYSVTGSGNPPWHYRNTRCVRTIEALADDQAPGWVRPADAGTVHNALDDAKYQAKCVSAAYRAICSTAWAGE